MRLRCWAAALTLVVGFVFWERHQLAETDQWAPEPGHWSFPTHYDTTIRKQAARERVPRSGVIGYRDERFGPDPAERAGEGMHSAIRGIFQYSLAPVILDEGAPHEQTLVVAKNGAYHVERRRPAGGR